jgi:hypothetical protein
MLIRPNLFDSRVLTKHLHAARQEGLCLPPNALESVKRWNERISSGALDSYTETQIEQAFNTAFFVELLGYKPIGGAREHNLVPKRSGDGRDVPDFVLGRFNAAGGVEKWVAVGEIKGLRTNLDLPQASRFSRETPVEQAFRYATKSKIGVEWVIVTNFQEIRLYRNGYTAAHHKWELQELTN